MLIPQRYKFRRSSFGGKKETNLFELHSSVFHRSYTRTNPDQISYWLLDTVFSRSLVETPAARECVCESAWVCACERPINPALPASAVPIRTWIHMNILMKKAITCAEVSKGSGAPYFVHLRPPGAATPVRSPLATAASKTNTSNYRPAANVRRRGGVRWVGGGDSLSIGARGRCEDREEHLMGPQEVFEVDGNLGLYLKYKSLLS